MSEAGSHLLVRAARGEAVERPPVWAMRQAGRWDTEFNKVRAGLGFYEFSADVERAAQASLCPRRFGVDGIILFYDITTLPFAMGLPFDLKPQVGPVPDRPIRTQADLDRLTRDPSQSAYCNTIELLKRVKSELNGALPVLAFAGAPFTVAAYCIGTGKHMEKTRQFAAENPTVWRGLLDRLSAATIEFMNAMAREGAAVYQLFDSWAGELTAEEYEEWAQPYHREILTSASAIPRILFVKECPYLDRMTQTGANVISLGARHNLAEARSQYSHLVFQGNVDSDVLKSGTTDQVESAVRNCLIAGGGTRHIVNLNHGVDKTTPVNNFAAFINAAKGN